jgi:hypothetical protein
MFGGGIHSMSNEYFFSPRAAQIAMPLIIACQGAKCDAPKRTEVAMLVVNRDAENVPFAD